MLQTLKMIEQDLQKAGLKCTCTELGKISYVEMGFKLKSTILRLRFISTKESKDIKVMTDDLAIFPEPRRAETLKLLNDINAKYKFFKFTMDVQGAVCAQYDIPLAITEGDSIGPVAVELALRCASIVDDVYPIIMHSLWG